MATAIGTYATAAALKTLANISGTADDTLLGLICDRVNQYIESCTKQVVAPITSTTYLYDGNGLRRIFLAAPNDEPTLGVGGARAVTLVEIAPYTGADFEEIAATDYTPRGKHGVIGPYRWLMLSDKPAGSYTTFPTGIDNVRVTMTAGWAAIPDDLTHAALTLARRIFNARQSGEQVIENYATYGATNVTAEVEKYTSPIERQIFKSYRMRWAG